MYPCFFEHLLLPVVEWKYGMNIRKHLRELEETQWWPIERLRELQNERLHGLIVHAYDKVPYYRSIFQERGLTPNDIQSVNDLYKLPILTKKQVWRNSKELLSSDFDQRKPKLNLTSGSTTGGSMAQRLQFYIDWESWSMSWACIYLGWRMAGYRFGDKMATLSGFSLFPDEKDMTFRDRVRLLIERNLALSVVRMSDDIMRRYSELIAKHRPKFLRGYPSGIYIFANYLKRNGLNPIEPKAIFTTAELLLPKQRSLIEEVFNCRVFDGYGCGDGGGSAVECTEHNGHHIPMQRVVMEFVNNEGQHVPAGQPGSIILTDLFNYSMPFIRYEVADIGVPSDRMCPCGRGLPLVESLMGRTTDVIKFRDGIVLSGIALMAILEHFPIQQFQAVQIDVDNLIVRIVRDKSYTKEDSDRLLRTLQYHVGPQANIDLEFVEEIPTTGVGKRLFIISNVSQG